MLVLTRKLGERVRIGDDVEVFVVGVSKGRVKLGFRAPREVVISRSEVCLQKNPETANADKLVPGDG